MSLHRVIAPPPLALAVHPAPPLKTREELKKEEEKKRADKEARAKVEADAKAAVKAEADGKEKKAGQEEPASPDTPASNVPEPGTPTSADAGQGGEGDAAIPQAKAKSKAKAKPAEAPVELRTAGEKDNAASKSDVPLPPLRLLPPVPPRPIRSRLDLNPAKPYPPIPADPRGAYHKYAKAMQGEVMYIDVTKDGWLVEQWKERSEREALARLTGEAERQRMREVAKAKRASTVRKVPATADGLILELWNDLVDAPANEISVNAFWAKYDWTDPKAEKHLQIMPEDEKAKAKAAAKAKLEKEIKAEEEARLAARAEREKEKEREKKAKLEAERGGDKEKKGDEEKPKQEEKKMDEDEKKEETSPGAEDKTRKEETPNPEEPLYQYPIPVEWTKEGVEEILSTVGMQCAFNTEKPLPKHWSTPGSSYLLLAHNHFLLRIDSDIQFKPEGTSDKFEALVTTANDRVFGEMVTKQMAAERKKKEKEYRDRKEKEYKEKKEKERKERKEKGGDDKEGDKKEDQEKGDDKQKSKDGQEDRKDKKHQQKLLKPIGGGAEIPADTVDTPGPMTPISNVKHRDGHAIRADEVAGKLLHRGGGKEDLAIIAVPVKEARPEGMNKDEKHEEEAMLVGPKMEEAVAKVKHIEEDEKKEEDKKADAEKDKVKAEDKDDKEKKAEAARRHRREKEKAEAPFDPVREADLIAKMLGPEAANIPTAELKMIFASMEAAQAESKARANALGDKKEGPMMWVWHEPCERWRWRNFAAGCAEIEDGGWEERDWKVFADDRGMIEFESEMEWEESLETDIHDWSC